MPHKIGDLASICRGCIVVILIASACSHCFSYGIRSSQDLHSSPASIKRLRGVKFKAYSIGTDSHLKPVVERVLNDDGYLDLNTQNDAGAEIVCEIVFMQREYQPVSLRWTLAVVTLGLVPIYMPYADTDTIHLRLMIRNNIIFQTPYQFGSSALAWLPLVVTGFWERPKIERPIRNMLTDFFLDVHLEQPDLQFQ